MRKPRTPDIYHRLDDDWGTELSELRESENTRRRQALPARFRTATTDEPLGDEGVYLFGPVGTGKTHRAAAWANQAIEAGLRVRWITVPAYLEDKRAAMSGAPAPATAEELASCDVLVLDDLGTEKATEWAREVLFGLVNRAYEADVQLLVTSNRRLADLASHLGDRIASRIAEICVPHEMCGPDRRLQAARARGGR